MKKLSLGIIVFSCIVLLLMFLFPVDILMAGNLTGSEYLLLKPYIEIGNVVIIVPSSSIIVFGLGVITIVYGVLLSQKEVAFKKWFGIALVVWGIGTILAGISYQSFGYELKCEGETYCLFTSWFELAYLYVTALSITIMGKAIALCSLQSSKINTYTNVLYIGFFVYVFTLVTGTIFNIYFLVTYEWFLVFFLPYFLSFFVINVRSYKLNQTKIDLSFITIWIIMLVVNVLYFGYLFSGIPEFLYENYRIWFSANDVLHVGLVYWMYDIFRKLK